MCVGGDSSDLILEDNQKINSCEEYTYLGTKIHLQQDRKGN